MLNPRLIKKRVNSIKNIGKITKALEMVSASKVQKSQNKAISAKPYASMIYELIGSLADDSEIMNIPLMRRPEEIKSDLYILVSTNRGLAGSLNTNLFKKIKKHLEGRSAKHSFITIGKKGRVFAMSNGELEADFSEYKYGSMVSAVTKIVTEGFVGKLYDEVYIVYSNFITVLSQDPTIKKILPISKEELAKAKEGEVTGFEGVKKEEFGTKMKKTSSFYYEPDPITVLTNLLPYYLEIQMSESLYEAEASEHSARMIAMKNASDNAAELTEGLSLEYNKARQSIITTEISDITTAQASLI